MMLYLIAGLGADKRVFKYLSLNVPNTVINWEQPTKTDSLKDYVKKLLPQINTKERFVILGVSFGGIVAIELAKICNPEKVILISSVETSNQLPKHLITIGKTGFLNIIPNSLIKPPKFIQQYLFGAKRIKLLNEIIDDTDPEFIRWALSCMINWSNKENDVGIIRIHGTKDKLIPLKGNALYIENGKHFMIVDNAEEISILVNEQMNYAG